jgi:oxazoline/thiazoline dehydrogenase
VRPPDPRVATDYGTSLRPSPGAGGCHELELYLAVRACDGLAPGLYRYDPSAHALERRGEAPGLGEDARLALGAAPDVVVVLAARFARVMWKYEAIGYALILKDAGVLLQTLGLCAAAMGLAWRTLGAGDSDAFCRAAGTDWWEESSVAEAALGGPLSPAPPR